MLAFSLHPVQVQHHFSNIGNVLFGLKYFIWLDWQFLLQKEL